jgi:hypothetical protein
MKHQKAFETFLLPAIVFLFTIRCVAHFYICNVMQQKDF